MVSGLVSHRQDVSEYHKRREQEPRSKTSCTQAEQSLINCSHDDGALDSIDISPRSTIFVNPCVQETSPSEAEQQAAIVTGSARHLRQSNTPRAKVRGRRHQTSQQSVQGACGPYLLVVCCIAG